MSAGARIDRDEGQRVSGVTPGEHWVDMATAGEDPWWMYAYSTMFASIPEQRWAAVSGEVHRLTGRSPATVRSTLARYEAP